MITVAHVPALADPSEDVTLQIGYSRTDQTVEIHCDGGPFPLYLTAQECEVLEVALRVARQSIRKS